MAQAYEEVPDPERTIDEMCEACPRGTEIYNPLLFKLLNYLGYQDGGCPIGRYELTDDEWVMLGVLRLERDIVTQEEAKEKREAARVGEDN